MIVKYDINELAIIVYLHDIITHFCCCENTVISVTIAPRAMNSLQKEGVYNNKW